MISNNRMNLKTIFQHVKTLRLTESSHYTYKDAYYLVIHHNLHLLLVNFLYDRINNIGYF